RPIRARSVVTIHGLVARRADRLSLDQSRAPARRPGALARADGRFVHGHDRDALSADDARRVGHGSPGAAIARLSAPAAIRAGGLVSVFSRGVAIVAADS